MEHAVPFGHRVTGPGQAVDDTQLAEAVTGTKHDRGGLLAIYGVIADPHRPLE